MAKTRKIGPWIAGVIIGLLVLLVASSLLVPLLVDEQAIRAKLQESLDRTMEGAIDFERLDISLLPPRGKLTNISISVPGKEAVGTTESVTAYLKILPLFRGRIQIGSVEVRRPDFRVGVPDIKVESEKEKVRGLSLENLAGGAYGALARLQSMQPDLEVLLKEGRLSLTLGGEPVVVIRDLDGQIELPPDELSLDFRSASNVWESFRFAAKIDRHLQGKGRIEVKHLQPHLITSLLLPQTKAGIGDSQIDARVHFEMKGFPNIEGDIEASAPKLTLHRGESAAILKVDALKGKVRFAERQMQFTLVELAMTNPGMKLSGRLHFDQNEPTASVELFGKEVNVGGLRDLSLSLAGDLPIVKKAFETALGGTIDQAVIISKGKSWEDLIEPMNMDIKATVSQVRVHIPEINLNLDGGKGKLFLSGGLFKGEDLSAQTSNAHAENGDLVMGIQGGNPAFHLGMDVRADLVQVPPFLKTVIEDRAFLEELEKIKRLEGTAQGRIVLGDRLKSIRPRIEVVEMSLSGDHEMLPFPVQISHGRFTYEGKQISWQDLGGRMGKTMVERTEGRIDWGDSPSLSAAGDLAVVDLGEIHPWISSTAGVPAELKRLKSVQGQASLSTFQLKGPLKNPKAWSLDGKGDVKDIVMESPGLPGVLNVTKARFSGNSERLEVQQAVVSLTDADLSLSGEAQGYMEGAPQVSLNFQGTVGPVAKGWVSSVLKFPPEIQFRAPLNFSKAALVWGKGKETSFTGDFNVGNGPQVSLDVTLGTQEEDILIRNLVINGTDGRATMSMTLGEKVIDIKFQGDLSETTMKQVMESPHLDGWIRGDFNARILKDRIDQSRVNGTIQAGNLSYRGYMGSPILLNTISLKALGDKVQVESAKLAWKDTEVAVKGNVGMDPGGLLVDLTVESEGFTWEKVPRIIEREKKKKTDEPGGQKGGIFGAVPVRGTIDVNAAYFQYGELRWEPFAFDLNLEGKRVEVKITNGRLCGIPTEATVKGSPEPMELKAEAGAESGEIRQTPCFLDARLATGQFDFIGDIAAWGASEDLIRNLHGQFTITAENGRIYRFGLLSKILSVVNITEIFKGRVPDVTGEGLGYKSAKFTGKIEQGRLELEEGYIDGHSMGLAFKGGIDLSTRKLDATVLVTVLKTVDTILENIPILGGILGENFIAIPVQVRGDINDPSVVPLPPSAVGSGLLGILERTLKLPGKLIQPFIPDKPKDERTRGTRDDRRR